MKDKFNRILILTRDASLRYAITRIKTQHPFNYQPVATYEEALGYIRTQEYGVFIIDWRHQPETCMQAVKLMVRDNPTIGIIAVIEKEQLSSVMPLTSFYIDEIVTAPIQDDDFFYRLKEVQTRIELTETAGMIGRSEIMRNVIDTVMQVAPTQATVFINGESGTGKEVLARAIHLHSPRRFKPFIAINCGALTETLLESELFGYEKGAFTGAVGRTKGKFELADKGSLFLDEVGEMSINTQIKFLRVLEEREFMRVGGGETIKVDVRIITATNANLEESLMNGTFRRDLYYRLKVFSIQMPALRERKKDIPLLINMFAKKFCGDNHLDFVGFTNEAYASMTEYHWPGNIRELRNIVESIVIMQPKKQINERDIESYLHQKSAPLALLGNPFPSQAASPNLPVFIHKPNDQVEREMIFQAIKALHLEIQDLKQLIIERTETSQYTSERPSSVNSPSSLVINQLSLPIGTPLEEIEREIILKTLAYYRGNKRKTAQSLKIGLRTLYRKLEQYNIEEYD